MAATSNKETIFDWEKIAEVVDLTDLIGLLPAQELLDLFGVEKAIKMIGRERFIEVLGAEKILDDVLRRIPTEQLQEILRNRQKAE